LDSFFFRPAQFLQPIFIFTARASSALVQILDQAAVSIARASPFFSVLQFGLQCPVFAAGFDTQFPQTELILFSVQLLAEDFLINSFVFCCLFYRAHAHRFWFWFWLKNFPSPIQLLSRSVVCAARQSPGCCFIWSQCLLPFLFCCRSRPLSCCHLRASIFGSRLCHRQIKPRSLLGDFYSCISMVRSHL
jgi:hypothetical protein